MLTQPAFFMRAYLSASTKRTNDRRRPVPLPGIPGSFLQGGLLAWPWSQRPYNYQQIWKKKVHAGAGKGGERGRLLAETCVVSAGFLETLQQRALEEARAAAEEALQARKASAAAASTSAPAGEGKENLSILVAGVIGSCPLHAASSLQVSAGRCLTLNHAALHDCCQASMPAVLQGQSPAPARRQRLQQRRQQRRTMMTTMRTGAEGPRAERAGRGARAAAARGAARRGLRRRGLPNQARQGRVSRARRSREARLARGAVGRTSTRPQQRGCSARMH